MVQSCVRQQHPPDVLRAVGQEPVREGSALRLLVSLLDICPLSYKANDTVRQSYTMARRRRITKENQERCWEGQRRGLC